MSQLFTSGGQSIGASASASVLPVYIQDWFPLQLTGVIFLPSKGLSRVFSNTTVQKHPILWCSAFLIVQFSHPYMTTEKTISLTRQTFVSKVNTYMCVCVCVCVCVCTHLLLNLTGDYDVFCLRAHLFKSTELPQWMSGVIKNWKFSSQQIAS